MIAGIKVPGRIGERIFKNPNEPIPERYTIFNVEGLKLLVKGKGVKEAWPVVRMPHLSA
ncbi:MAG: hypothetical protein AB1424_11635 [Thermodesulfobacteriota bacterium]